MRANVLFDSASLGHDSGPLFAPPVKQRPPKGGRVSRGTKRYRKEKLHTPPWANRKVLRQMRNDLRALNRERARQGKVPLSLDHIVPLDGNNVCGLHVENNLRVIPEIENQRKSNRWWPDSWHEQGSLL